VLRRARALGATLPAPCAPSRQSHLPDLVAPETVDLRFMTLQVGVAAGDECSPIPPGRSSSRSRHRASVSRAFHVSRPDVIGQTQSARLSMHRVFRPSAKASRERPSSRVAAPEASMVMSTARWSNPPRLPLVSQERRSVPAECRVRSGLAASRSRARRRRTTRTTSRPRSRSSVRTVPNRARRRVEASS
jgi:hypothetical protein